MHPKTAKLFFGVALICVTANPLWAQNNQSGISGTVTDSGGRVVPNAKVVVKNVSTGESTDAQADSTGLYRLSNLATGDYEVSASAEGMSGQAAKVKLVAGTPQTLPLILTPAPAQQSSATPPAVPSENLPNAPPSSQTAPSLADLGFSKSETQSNAAQQALLDKRTHMLKIHQRIGLIATIPMVASVVTSLNAGGRSEGTASRDLHVALGALTGDLYGITAYYAIRAPKIPGTETRGPIRFHKAMAWIHGPGMVLTPILGAMAFSQKNNGEKVHGLAAAHGPVAIVTAGAFGAALLSVSVKF